MADRLRVDYSKLDYTSLLDDLRTRIPVLIPEWTDVLDSNVGMFYVQLFAAINDLLLFYLDNRASECFLDTAVTPESIYSIVKLIGFNPQGYEAASTVLTFYVLSPYANDIPIPAGTTCVSQSSNRIRFSTLADAVLSAGQTSVDVPAKQGSLLTETVTGDGTKYQGFRLGSTSPATDTITLRVQGRTWRHVETFVGEGPTECFMAEVGEAGVVTIRFGNDVEGKILASGVEATISYFEANGLIKNLAANSITRLAFTLTDALGGTVDVRVKNTTAVNGGQNPDTPLDMKYLAPAVFKTGERAVTKSDYTALLERRSDVASVKVLDINDDERIPLSYVRCYIVPTLGVAFDQNKLRRYLEGLSMTTVIPDPREASYTTVDITATIHVFKAYDSSVVRSNVIQALTSYMARAVKPVTSARLLGAVAGLQMGQILYIANLYNTILAVQGVADTTITVPAGDVTPETTYTLLTPGTITVTVAGTV